MASEALEILRIKARAALELKARAPEVRRDAGASYAARAAEGLAMTPEDKLATVQGYYPFAYRDVVDPENYVINEGGEQRLFNKPGLEFGDVAAQGRMAAEMVGGTAGAALGALAPVPGATAGGAGMGSAIAAEIANEIGKRLMGTQDTRSLGEHALDTGLTGALSAGGQQAGEFLGQGVRAGVKKLFRGVGPGQVAENMGAFNATGAAQSAGQVLQKRWVQSTESLLSGLPGAAGRFHKKALETADRVGQFIEQSAYRLSGRGLEPERAGRVVQQGIEDFAGRFRDVGGKLYDKLDTMVPADAPVTVTNSLDSLKSIASPVPSAPNISDALAQPTAKKLLEALAQDAPGGIPYGVLKELRSAIGRKLTSTSLIDDIPRGEYKRLYGALSEDMKTAAEKYGGNDAIQAWRRADAYWRAGTKRIDDFLEPLEGRVIPEKVYKALETGGRDGATQLRAVRKSVTPEQWKVVAGTAMRRLGKATAGQQDETGEVFSIGTFLTNWNRLSSEAKDALFSGPMMGGMRQDLEAVARVAARASEVGKTFSNPSGTSGASIGKGIIYGGLGGGAAGLLGGETGALIFLGGLAAGGVGANAAARLLTNPKFVQWLASGTRVSPTGVAAHLGRLVSVARDADPDIREALREYIDTFTSLSPTGQSPAPISPPGRSSEATVSGR